MEKRAIIPQGLEAVCEAAAMSPAIVSGGHVFLTGLTGSAPDGTMPTEAESQFRAAFEKIRGVLAAADLDMDTIVEMTSYHVGLRAHFDLFDAVRRDVFSAPYPAWTALEVAGLRRVGAVVEIRVIAAL